MIVFLEGGPYDGQFRDTKLLLGKEQRAPEIEYYDYTPRVKVSTKSGRSAPIWTYNETRAAGLRESR